MKKKDCTRCGRCCIVCTDIQLTREEVREGLYPRRRRNRHHSEPVRGWSKWILMRGIVYEPQLKREIFACVYWDPLTRNCLIYEDRPTVCQQFSCTEKGGPRIHKYWLQLKKGNNKLLCTDA